MNETIIEVDGLSRAFGEIVALDRVTLSIPRGVVFGLVGENGAGKTTLIKHLLGLFRARQGSVRVFGLDPIQRPADVLGRIGYLSEERDLPDWMRLGELTRYNQSFYPTWDQAFAQRLCEQFELDKKQRIRSMSRGQRARVGLLSALAHRPDLLLLDEPSSGLDPIARRDILTAIIRTVADEGRTVLFSSHLLDEVQRVADSVAMIDRGRIVLSASLDEIVASHHRLVLRFEEDRTTQPELSGALSWAGGGREWTAVCNGELEILKQAAVAAGASVVDESPASLDEVFLARAGNLVP